MFLNLSAQGPSDVYVRLIRTSADGPRAERVNAFCIISDVVVRHKKYILNHHHFLRFYCEVLMLVLLIL